MTALKFPSFRLPQANLLQNFILFSMRKTSAETEAKLDFISSIWGDHHILRLDGKTGNAYGVIQVSKESILIRLSIVYWGRRLCILKVVMFLRTNHI